MIDDFEKSANINFDEDNSEHNKLISEFVDNNKEKYINQYQNVLNDFDMKIIFIKQRGYNIKYSFIMHCKIFVWYFYEFLLA